MLYSRRTVAPARPYIYASSPRLHIRFCRVEGTRRFGGAESHIRDVSAEALCAGFHKPLPRNALSCRGPGDAPPTVAQIGSSCIWLSVQRPPDAAIQFWRLRSCEALSPYSVAPRASFNSRICRPSAYVCIVAPLKNARFCRDERARSGLGPCRTRNLGAGVALQSRQRYRGLPRAGLSGGGIRMPVMAATASMKPPTSSGPGC